MKNACRIHVIAITLLVGALTLVGYPAWGEEKRERVMIGRIAFVEGQLLRYVFEEQDWVAIVKDAPFGLDDALYSDQQSRAEFIMPNNTWIRIGGNTQLQMITLKSDVTEVDVASGMSRFYNKGETAVVKATTPFGYVVAYGGTAFDIYVGDTSVEVLAIEGTVDFVHQADGSRYEVKAGESSVLADAQDIAAGDGLVDADWDDWNQKRDQSWQKRVDVKGDSYEYLPSSLKYESDVFEENGKWEKVEYQGEKRTMWRPTRVSSSWAPYSDGRWSVYNGDNCWIPEESFGYTTHHYGSWVRVESCGCWYWTPPVRRTVVQVDRRPDYYEDDCDCDWYPGRVAWIHSQEDVGWIPLTPSEPYYTNNYWGGLSVVVSNVASVAINIGSYHNYNHAIIVNQNNFYNVNNYNNVRVTNINNTTIINNYHGAAVVNNTVVNNFNTNRNRYNFTNVNVQRTPHESVVRRIERNQGFARETRNVGAGDIGRDLSGFRTGRLDRTKQVNAPRVSSRLVDRQDVNKPLTGMQLPQRELRQKGRQAEPISNKILPGRDAQGRMGRGPDGIAPGISRPTREGTVGQRPSGSRLDTQQGQTGQGETGRTGLRPVRPDLGKDRRGPDQGGVDQGPASQGDRGGLRPVRPGLGRDRTGPDQGTADQGTTGQTGKPGLRPVRPGHGVVDQGSADQGSQGIGDRGRVRPPRLGQEPQSGGPDGAAQTETDRGKLRPVRPGRAIEDQGLADQGSQGLKDRGRVRPPRPGQEPQPDGAELGAAPGSDRTKVRPVRPGMDSQPGDTGGSLKDQRRQQMMDQRQQQQDQRRQQQETQPPDQGQSRRQQMEQQRQQQQDQRRQQQETQPPDQGQSRRQQMEQQRQQQETQRQQEQQQKQQQQETQRQQQQQQRQQQQEMQRQQQQQERQKQQETQRQQQQQQQQQQRQQQQEMQRQQQQQERQKQQETQRQQQQQQQQRQQQEMQRQQQQQERQKQQETQRQQQQQQQQQQRQQQQEMQRQQQQQQRQQQIQQQQQQKQQIQQQQQQQRQQQQQQQQKKKGQQQDPNQPLQQ